MRSCVKRAVGKKVFWLAEPIAAACAGLVSDMQIVVREVEAYANLLCMDTGRLMSVRSAAKVMSYFSLVDGFVTDFSLEI